MSQTSQLIHVMAIGLTALNNGQNYDLFVDALVAITNLAQAELVMQMQSQIDNPKYLH